MHNLRFVVRLSIGALSVEEVTAQPVVSRCYRLTVLRTGLIDKIEYRGGRRLNTCVAQHGFELEVHAKVERFA